jgi:two-component system nitrogen regulation response regulator NtrX
MTALPIPKLLGTSEAIRTILADIDCAARTDAKVLVTGETGVGKEVVAQLIHRRSGRSSSSLLTLNCAGLPDTLLESELFGHARGSFTGAYRDKPGLLELANHGTVFLDEVGEMSARMQVVLLRFLETGEIQRVGTDRGPARVNVRLITATNRELLQQVAAGSFREDLYFRLNVIRIVIPPLRERLEDLALLVENFVMACSDEYRVPRPEIAASAMDAFRAHRWPGNIRELKNVVERLVLRAGGRTITADDLPAEIVASPKAAPEPAPTTSIAEGIAAQMLRNGESFWSVAYPLFMSRDLTRADLRRVVQIGLENTNGNYRLVLELFNMPSEDYKKFLGFLRKHDCHLPCQRFRTLRADLKRIGHGAYGPLSEGRRQPA